MGIYAMRLPDVGEGIAEAELVEWSVAVGDMVGEDDVIAAVMTDKATVEIPAGVSGRVAWLGAEIGDIVPVGSELIRFEVAGPGNVEAEAPPADQKTAAEQPADDISDQSGSAGDVSSSGAERGREMSSRAPEGLLRGRVLAAPVVRRMAREAGIDLTRVRGSGPAGRVLKTDLEAARSGAAQSASGQTRPRRETIEIKVTGLRRQIAQRMARSVHTAAHFSYVEEVDVEEIEDLRGKLNLKRKHQGERLTLLPFLVRAIAVALEEFPQMNAHYDDGRDVIIRHGSFHAGLATQTDQGLKVPVLRDADRLTLNEMASGIARLAETARDGSITRDELSGSTLTITSLGALGGVMTTPVLNLPEVAIIGVNKIVMRPHWTGDRFEPRRMMNLSSSFDHRVIDGYDAAQFVQRIKALIEEPALMFIEG